jgi:hypothetical protein
MKNYLLLILILLEYPLFRIARKIDPTNMAGFGLDMIPAIAAFIYNIFIVWTIKRDWDKGVFPKLYLIAVVISASLILSSS